MLAQPGMVCVSPGPRFLTTLRCRCPLSCPRAPWGSGTVTAYSSIAPSARSPSLAPSPRCSLEDTLCSRQESRPGFPASHSPAQPPTGGPHKAAPSVTFPNSHPNFQQLRGCGSSGQRAWGACSPFFSAPEAWARGLSSAPQDAHQHSSGLSLLCPSASPSLSVSLRSCLSDFLWTFSH